jgi:formylglycine-generating enzyme required for sulfatase activity
MKTKFVNHMALSLLLLEVSAWSLGHVKKIQYSELPPTTSLNNSGKVANCIFGQISEDSLASECMISIAAGCFDMGAENDDIDEAPVHKVCLSAYEIDVHEVTQGEYQDLMGAHRPNLLSCGKYCPVENVDWNKAREYCRRLGKRLPTEAEWEYAARGADSSRGYEFSGSNDIDSVAWYWNNREMANPQEVNHVWVIHEVCTKQKNEIGLCDMSGNVWEWVSDAKGDYSEDPQQDPQGPDSDSLSLRVFRGGSWLDFPNSLRSTARMNANSDLRSNNIGFRCARSMTTSVPKAVPVTQK